MPARLSLVHPVAAPEELVDPYAYALAVAFLLSPDESDAERALEEILTAYCEQHELDMDEMLSKCSAYLRESGVIG